MVGGPSIGEYFAHLGHGAEFFFLLSSGFRFIIFVSRLLYVFS